MELRLPICILYKEEVILGYSSVQFSRSVVSLCDPMTQSTPGFPVHHQLPEFTQTHAH